MIESKNGKEDSDKEDSDEEDSAKEVLESLRKRKEKQKVKKLEILRLSRDIKKQN